MNYDEWIRLSLTFDDWLAIGRAHKYCNESEKLRASGLSPRARWEWWSD